MATLNINSWQAFKSKLTEERFQEYVSEHTVLCLQETKLDGENIRDAVEYCRSRGWVAVFSEAQRRESGLHAGGVAVLVKDKLNIGVARTLAPASRQAHRLLAVQLDVPGFGCMVAASAYFEAVSGLSETNRELLADIALLQHDCRLPVAVGGDFNMDPKTL